MLKQCPTCGQDVPVPNAGDGFIYSTVGKTRTYRLTHQQVQDWQALYPALDVLSECRKAKGWLEANWTKRKTAVGMPRFLVNWLNRATDAPRSQQTRKLGPNDPGYYDRIRDVS